MRSHALTAVLLASSLAAQSTTVSPPGFATIEGTGMAFRFGSYSDMRVQWIDGECRTLRSVKAIGMRRDVGRQIVAYPRAFKNVTIDLGLGDHASATNVFQGNHLTTPTRLFSGAFRMPAFPYRANGPAPWDARLRVALRSKYVLPGNRDLVVDWRMTGGTLANGGRIVRFGYPLDSVAIGAQAAFERSYGNGSAYGGAGCRDSRLGAGAGAYTRLEIVSDSTTKRVRVRASGRNYPVAAYVQTAIGLGLHQSGVAIPGVTCNRLHVDMTKPYFVLRSQVSGAGTFWYDIPPSQPNMPFQPAWVGVQFVTQTGWADTRTGALLLSGAGTSIYPPLAPLSWKRRAVWRNDTSSYTGVLSKDGNAFPIVRYEH